MCSNLSIGGERYLARQADAVLGEALVFGGEELLDEVERHERLAEDEDLVADELALAQDVHEEDELAAVLQFDHVVVVDELRPPGAGEGRRDAELLLWRRLVAAAGAGPGAPHVAAVVGAVLVRVLLVAAVVEAHDAAVVALRARTVVDEVGDGTLRVLVALGDGLEVAPQLRNVQRLRVRPDPAQLLEVGEQARALATSGQPAGVRSALGVPLQVILVHLDLQIRHLDRDDVFVLGRQERCQDRVVEPLHRTCKAWIFFSSWETDWADSWPARRKS